MRKFEVTVLKSTSHSVEVFQVEIRLTLCTALHAVEQEHTENNVKRWGTYSFVCESFATCSTNTESIQDSIWLPIHQNYCLYVHNNVRNPLIWVIFKNVLLAPFQVDVNNNSQHIYTYSHILSWCPLQTGQRHIFSSTLPKMWNIPLKILLFL